MSEIKEEIAAYELLRPELEEKHMGKWVLLYNLKLIDIYESFEAAAEDAVKRFGGGPYLIRQVGAPPCDDASLRHVSPVCLVLGAGSIIRKTVQISSGGPDQAGAGHHAGRSAR